MGLFPKKILVRSTGEYEHNGVFGFDSIILTTQRSEESLWGGRRQYYYRQDVVAALIEVNKKLRTKVTNKTVELERERQKNKRLLEENNQLREERTEAKEQISPKPLTNVLGGEDLNDASWAREENDLPDSWFIFDVPSIRVDEDMICIGMSLLDGDVVCLGISPITGEYAISIGELKRVIFKDCMEQLQGILDGTRLPSGQENIIRQALNGEIVTLRGISR